ncbi:MAG: type II secretion system protein [Phycisphaerae bacterium]
MAFPRKRRAAFTLTEMLMAAGILGIGLTMVASIFPVAVDQSRRSRDLTMAALCARSAMARARADQNAIYDWLRGRPEYMLNFWNPANPRFPGKHIVYNPSVFLYTSAEKPTSRTYDGVNAWDAGNYVARVFATKTSADGPYRLTIFVCRSIGKPPSDRLSADLWQTATRPKPGPGTYVLEYTRYRGWGHLLDYVMIDTAGLKTGYPAVGLTSIGSIIPSTSTNILRVPDAVAVFHTILGE